MKLKVCGLTQLDQLKQLDEWGASFAGMIFYDKSPRYVKKFNINQHDLKREKCQLKKVGVFVNESVDIILKTVDEWGLDMVQLHGDESPKYCEQVSEYVQVIKAFRLSGVNDVIWKVHPYLDFVDQFLFDSGGSGAYGGTGEKFNWGLLENLPIGKSFLLSGGIDADDLNQINSLASTQQELIAIDVNSKFELSPGIKDMVKIKSFLNVLNNGYDKGNFISA